MEHLQNNPHVLEAGRIQNRSDRGCSNELLFAFELFHTLVLPGTALCAQSRVCLEMLPGRDHARDHEQLQVERRSRRLGPVSLRCSAD